AGLHPVFISTSENARDVRPARPFAALTAFAYEHRKQIHVVPRRVSYRISTASDHIAESNEHLNEQRRLTGFGVRRDAANNVTSETVKCDFARCFREVVNDGFLSIVENCMCDDLTDAVVQLLQRYLALVKPRDDFHRATLARRCKNFAE